MAAPLPTFADLLAWLVSSPRMAGIRVLLGRKHLSDAGAPNRVVIIPTDGNLGSQKQDQLNLAETPITLECHCWGKDYDDAWRVLGALMNAVEDYRIDPSKNVEITRGACAFSTSDDTATQGEEVTAAITIRMVIERGTYLIGDSTGTVNAIQFENQAGTVTPPSLPLP